MFTKNLIEIYIVVNFDRISLNMLKGLKKLQNCYTSFRNFTLFGLKDSFEWHLFDHFRSLIFPIGILI